MMNPPPAPVYKDSSKMRRWFIAGILAIPVICCGGGLLYSRKWIDSFDNSADLDRLVAEARKHNLPMETKDFIDPKAVPEAENSYPLVEKLMKEFPKMGDLRKTIADFEPKRGGRMPSQTLAFLGKTKAIAKYSKYDAHKDYDLGMNILFPEFMYFRDMARTLGKQAEQNSANRDLAGALQNLTEIKMLATQLSKEKTMIANLVNISINMIYLRTTSRMMTWFAHDKQALSAIKTALQAKIPMTDLNGVMQGEFYYGLTFLRNFDLFGGTKAMTDDSVFQEEIDESKLQRSGLPKGVIQRGMLAAFIANTIKIQEIFQKETNTVEASRKADLYMSKVPVTASNAYPLLAITVWSNPGEAIERPDLVRKMQLQGIELLMNRKGDTFPGKIPDIADTIAGGTVQYKRTANGFLIYSFGKNQKDEGGPKNKVDRKNSDDIGFEFPAVATE